MPQRRRIQYQQAANPTQPIIPDVSSWHRSFAAPIRQVLVAAVAVTAFVKTDTIPNAPVAFSPEIQFTRQIQYQAIAQPVSVSVTPITVDEWFRPLDEPRRFLVRIPVTQQQFLAIDPYSLTQPESVTEDRWHQPWSEPVRKRPALSIGLQRFAFPDPFPRPPGMLNIGNWYKPLEEPVRLPKGLKAYLQQFFTVDPVALTQLETTTEDRWHQGWSAPVRFKVNPRLRIALMASGSVDTDPAAQVDLGKIYSPWFAPLSEPYPYKRGLKTHLQQTTAIDTVLIPSPSKFLEGWYNWLNTPVRLPKSLKVYLQQDRAHVALPHELFPDILVSIDATETSGDVFLSAVVVAGAVAPTVTPRALVSIIEVSADGRTPISIIEG